MVRKWIVLALAAIFVGAVTAQFEEDWNYNDDDWWSVEEANDDDQALDSSETKQEMRRILDDYVQEPVETSKENQPDDLLEINPVDDDTDDKFEVDDDDKLEANDDDKFEVDDDDDKLEANNEEQFEAHDDDIKQPDIGLLGRNLKEIEDADEKFDDENGDEQNPKSLEEENAKDDNFDSDTAVEKDIERYQKILEPPQTVISNEKTANEDIDENSYDVQNEDVEWPKNGDEDPIEVPEKNLPSLTDAIIEDTKNVLREDNSNFEDDDNYEDNIDKNQNDSGDSAEIGERVFSKHEVSPEAVLDKEQNIEKINSNELKDDIVSELASESKENADADNDYADVSDEDTVKNVYKDLHEDLKKLFETWDKLNDDSSEENKNVKEYEEKYGRPYKEDVVLSQRDDYDLYDPTDELEIDSNLKEIFENAHDNDDFEDAPDPINNILESPKSVSDNNSLVADQKEPQEDVLVKATTTTTFKPILVKELTPAQYDDLIRQFKMSHADELDTHREDFGRSIAPVHLTMSTDEILEITSPNYPNTYPTNNVIDWIIEGEGMGVEVNVTDLEIRGVQGDYLVIKPGGADESEHDGLVFTFHLNEPRRYRFTNVDRLFVRFVSGPGLGFLRGFQMKVKMIWPLENADDLDDSVTDPVTPPTPPYLHTVYLGGLSLRQFQTTMSEEFRRLLADMATMYVHANGFDVGINSTLETTVLRSTHCSRSWPDFETCIAVTFGISEVYEDELTTTILSDEHLRSMWETYVSRDPFATRLRNMGLAEYAVPNDGRVLAMWLVLATGVVAAAALLALVLWKCSCFEDYTRMKSFSDTESLREEKRDLDLYPTPHQTLPPLYSDEDFKWADAKYDDTTRVDLGGIANRSYVKDELFDIDSDEDVINQREGKSSYSARDMYQV